MASSLLHVLGLGPAVTGEDLGKWGPEGQRWGVDMTAATSQGSTFSAGPRRGREHESGSETPTTCFLKRKEQENAEPSGKDKAVQR